MKRVILYVDGFNLYFGLRSKGWKRYYWLDPGLLGKNLLQADQSLERVKYFTARISASGSDPDKRKRQATWLEAVECLTGVDLFYGHYLAKPQTCFTCRATWVSHEEKMTDVNIAVEMLRDAYEDRFDTALVLSADSDLAPVVEAIRQRFPTKWIVAIGPPDRHSKRLDKAASASFQLGRVVLENSQLPDSYAKPDGFVLHRPVSWK